MLNEGQTQPPPKLSERDLLTLMDRYGIGTDATVSNHIANQQARGYASKDHNQLFSASNLGVALIDAYKRMNLQEVYECAPRSLQRTVRRTPHATGNEHNKTGLAALMYELAQTMRR